MICACLPSVSALVIHRNVTIGAGYYSNQYSANGAVSKGAKTVPVGASSSFTGRKYPDHNEIELVSDQAELVTYAQSDPEAENSIGSTGTKDCRTGRRNS